MYGIALRGILQDRWQATAKIRDRSTFPERRAETCGAGTTFLIGVTVTRRAGITFLIGVTVTRRAGATFLIGATVTRRAGATFPGNAPVTNLGEHAVANVPTFH